MFIPLGPLDSIAQVRLFYHFARRFTEESDHCSLSLSLFSLDTRKTRFTAIGALSRYTEQPSHCKGKRAIVLFLFSQWFTHKFSGQSHCSTFGTWNVLNTFRHSFTPICKLLCKSSEFVSYLILPRHNRLFDVNFYFRVVNF